MYNISYVPLFFGGFGGSKTPSSAILGLFWVKRPFFLSDFSVCLTSPLRLSYTPAPPPPHLYYTSINAPFMRYTPSYWKM